MPEHINAVMDRATLESNEPTVPMPLDAAPWPEHLDEAVGAYVTQQATIADRELDGSDPLLYPIRSKVRASVEPLLGAFDAQLVRAENQHGKPGPTADEQAELNLGRLEGGDSELHPYHNEWLALQVRIAERGTMTDKGYADTKRNIAANRKGAVAAALKSLHEEIAAAEAKVQAQRAATRVVPKPADVQAAVDVMLQLERTTPTHGAPILAEYIVDVAQAKDPAKAAAILPMLKSLYEAGDLWRGSAELKGLIETAEKLTRTWEQTVTAARLERIARTRWELAEYAKAVTLDPADRESAFSGLVDGEGNPRLFPDEPAPTRSGDVSAPPKAKPKAVRVLRSK